jgi:TonB family protein
MRVTLALLLVLTVMGCSIGRDIEVPVVQPELIRMTALPALPAGLSAVGLQLNVLFRVLGDGTVADVRILGSSGDDRWDSLACQSMRQWRFARIRREGVPGDIWFRQLVIVQTQTQEPIILTLGELTANSRREADSLYTLLQGGVDFDSLARQVSGLPPSEHPWFIGTVDIVMFPRHVREELRGIREDGVTRPLRVGERYAIYKRYSKNISVMQLP